MSAQDKSTISFLREALLGPHAIKLHLGCLLPAVILRAVSLLRLLDTDSLGGAAGLMLRGVCSDVAMSLILVVAVGWLLARKTAVYLAWAVVWSVVFSGNAEHIAFNDANFSLLLARYAATEEFLAGSMLVGRILSYSLIVGLFSAGVVWVAGRRPFTTGMRRLYLVVCGALALGLLIPAGAGHDSWIYENVLESNTRYLWHRSAERLGFGRVESRRADLGAKLTERYLTADLSGTPRIQTKRESPNVLLVLIEGLGDGYLNDRNMPFLTEFARQNMRYENFYAHQLLTIKGMYSLLAGDYPNLQFVDSKADILGSFGADRDLLPRRLSQLGYETVYLQSAPLGFMRKDLFAANAGFQKVYGMSHFDSWHHKNPWGVDDRTLFERALGEIGRAGNRERPWMLTLLTTGTHHPYNVPPDFGAEPGNPTLEDAVRYADLQLKRLVEGLDAMGQLDDTLIFVTSDEVKGDFSQGVAGAIDHYRSPLVVHVPGGHREVVRETFGHVDFYLSVLDYLDAPAVPDDVIGRSVFRSYGKPRNLLIGRDNDIAVLEGGDRAHFVPRSFDSVASYRKDDATGQFVSMNVDAPSAGEIQAVVNAVDRSSADLSTDVIFTESNRYLSANSPVFAQMSFSVKKGETLTWDVKLSTKEIPSGLVDVKLYAGFPREGQSVQYVFYDEFTINPRSELAVTRSFEAPTDIPRLDNWLWVNTPDGRQTFLEHAHIKRGSR